MKTTKEIEQELSIKTQRVSHWEKFNTVPAKEELVSKNKNLWAFAINDFYEYDIDSRGMVNLRALEVN